jgi:hypothetical protein
MKPIPALLVGSLMLTCAALAGADTVDREYNESFAVSPGDTLRLLHGDGDVEIKPSANDRMDVHVRYLMKARGLGGPRDFEVDFGREGSVITVEGREVGSNFFVGGSTNQEYRYVIEAPPYVQLELRGDDGDVRVTEWGADIGLDSEDGDVRIDGLSGDLSIDLDDGDVDLYDCAVGEATLRLQDGDVTLRGGSGDWRFDVDDGDLDLRDLAAESVWIATEDGDVELGLLPAAGPEIEIRTDDGDVLVELPPGIAGSFDLTCDDGSMRVNATEAVIESKREHHIEGVLGGGGNGSLRIHTEDGDITLRDGR